MTNSLQLSLVHELIEAVDWRMGKGNDSLAKGKGSPFGRRKLIESVEKKEEGSLFFFPWALMFSWV
jgi:hypothetical protein